MFNWVNFCSNFAKPLFLWWFFYEDTFNNPAMMAKECRKSRAMSAMECFVHVMVLLIVNKLRYGNFCIFSSHDVGAKRGLIPKLFDECLVFVHHAVIVVIGIKWPSKEWHFLYNCRLMTWQFQCNLVNIRSKHPRVNKNWPETGWSRTHDCRFTRPWKLANAGIA